MDQTVARLQSAFRLAQADLEHADPKRVASARREVGRFLLAAPRGVPGAGTGGVWFGSGLDREPSVDELRALQADVRNVLDALVSGAPMAVPPTVTWTWTPLPVTEAASGRGGARRKVRRRVVVKVEDASIRDRVIGALLLLLAGSGANRVSACQHCGRAILKVGRREYCQRAECQRERRQDYWQRYKTTPEAKRARSRYYEAHGWTLGARSSTGRGRKEGK